ncbi:Interleukin-17F [Operophtera brumata]|uniref:Interleukin-17F n=1 Tax=Operophtera brumata TaxID=104452 RepID=A0A0L7KR58_OPEBR|nr:Interleukin-17F [Operophtera brumata]
MAFVTLVTLVLACIVLSTIAAPTHNGTITMDLKEVMNKSVCPIRIHIDEDENRIPRRIKTLKCATTPNPMCHLENMKHACCRSLHLDFNMGCVEVTDNVLVRYIGLGDDARLHKYPVAVGCACMIRDQRKAKNDR